MVGINKNSPKYERLTGDVQIKQIRKFKYPPSVLTQDGKYYDDIGSFSRKNKYAFQSKPFMKRKMSLESVLK